MSYRLRQGGVYLIESGGHTHLAKLVRSDRDRYVFKVDDTTEKVVRREDFNKRVKIIQKVNVN